MQNKSSRPKINVAQQILRTANLVLNFDRNWYVSKFVDVKSYKFPPIFHFLRHGINERRDPSAWFDSTEYLGTKYPTLSPVVTDYQLTTRGDQWGASGLPRQYLTDLSGSRDLSIFFNVATTALSGGMLSIDRFTGLALELTKDRPLTEIVVSGVPLDREPAVYTLFKPHIAMVHLWWIVKNTDPTNVRIFVPEVFAYEFIQDILNTPLYRIWMKQRQTLAIVILNQNNDYMPPPEPFLSFLRELTLDITISTAHPRYCTQRLSNQYGVPVKQLTPLLPKMPFNKLANRRPVFLLSPDVMFDEDSSLTHETVVDQLRGLFPEFDYVVVRDLPLEDYINLASQVQFSLTFGEGMDGFFIEPILSGGVSFAVYNNTFFPPQFSTATTVASNWVELIALMTSLVPRLLREPGFYDSVSGELRDLLAENYSREISKNDLAELIDGKTDYLPTRRVELFTNIRDFLEKERQFRFHDGVDDNVKFVTTPDGLILQHLGSEFYSVLYEIYVRRDYDLSLKHGIEYILLDIGANVGMASLYLRNKFKNIREIYAYEPLHDVAKIARANIAANIADGIIHLKEIGLSDRYEVREFEFFKDWTTAFSTDDNTLDEFLKTSKDGSSSNVEVAEVEVMRVDLEFASLIENLGERRIAIKCDTQGSEFAIFESLDECGYLAFVDAIVVETHFRDPKIICDILVKNGFEVESRMDSVENNVFTVKAFRQ